MSAPFEVSDPFSLSGKRALVTGASRGIGAGIALALAAAGADIVGVARTMNSAGDGENGAVANAVRALGREFIPIATDLAVPGAATRLAEKLDASGRPVDILINNAGIANRAPAENHTDEMFAEVMAINLAAPFALAREFGTRMLERGSGRIVFLASLMSFQGGRNVVGYAASKSAVVGVVHALANEWAGRGVNVNAVAPGYITTDLTVATHGDPGRNQEFVDRIPAGRWGTAGDLGGAVVFLCAPASAYVHGVVLPVDGGWLVR